MQNGDAGNAAALRATRGAAAMLRGIGCAVALGVLLWLAVRSGVSGQAVMDVLCRHIALVIPAVGLGMCFIVGRSMLLAQACSDAGVKVTLGSAVRLFCEGVAIESVCWPGKAWADLHRASALGEGTMARRAAALGLFRLGGGTGGLIVAATACAVSLGAGLLPMFVSGGALLIVTMALVASKHRIAQDAKHTNWSWRVSRLIAWGALASACDMAAMTLLAAKVGHVSVTWFVGVFAVTSVVAAVSMLPLGLGVLDLGLWHVLTAYAGLDPAAAATVLLLYRLTGPLLTASIGAAALLMRVAGGLNWTLLQQRMDRTRNLGGEL
jgi:uncharacterized membrane protein YbhN (UPF0104 family)